MSVRRESPRDAIRNWLAHTEQPSEAGEIKLTRDEGRDGQKSRSRHRHRRGRSRSRHEAHDVSLQGLNSNTQHKAKISESRAALQLPFGYRDASVHTNSKQMKDPHDWKPTTAQVQLSVSAYTHHSKPWTSSNLTMRNG